MDTITLDSRAFWKWLDIRNIDGTGINKYIDLIANPLLIRQGYLVDQLRNNRKTSEDSSIMMNLSECVPRKYFLELQYCASVYTTVFGKIFPPFIFHVEELAYIEWLLYTESKHLPYRDHLVHMFKVAHCADFFLSHPTILAKTRDTQFQSSHFIQWCSDQEIPITSWSEKEKNNILQTSLFLASIFHDFGYGYFYLTKYKERLFKLYQWLLPRADTADPHTAPTQTILKSLPAYFVRKKHKWLSDNLLRNTVNVVSGFFHDCLPLNHSIASSFFLLDLVENLRRSGAVSQELYVAFHLAAEACMLHDMTNKNNWAHLYVESKGAVDKDGLGHFINHHNQKDTPLAILLILSDELSAWERPRLVHSPRGDIKMVTELDFDNSITSLQINISEKNETILITPTAPSDGVKGRFITGLKELTCLKNSDKQNGLEAIGFKIGFS